MTILRCPLCHEDLNKTAAGFRCDKGHSYDLSKEGYVNLLLANKKKSKMPGDSKEMLVARRRFLEQDFYFPLVEALHQLIDELDTGSPQQILDIGCGEGYFTGKLSQFGGSEYWGVDVSKPAIQMAAKKYRDCNFAVASSQDLPFHSSSFSVLFNINAPINAPELVRLLKDQGVYLRVFPAARHLWQLKELIYDTPREHAAEVMEIPGLEQIKRKCVEFVFTPRNGFVFDLLMMTPYYWHATPQQQQHLKELNNLDLQAGFVIDVYRK